MNTKMIPLLLLTGLMACQGTRKQDEQPAEQAASKENTEAKAEPIPYAEIDSVFTIDAQPFHVRASQYDLTESVGSTAGNATYVCLIEIRDTQNKVLLSDSLFRDSWGYKGKTASIDAYQVNFPLLSSEGNKIIFKFNVYDQQNEEGIWGFVDYDVKKNSPSYYWQEALDAP
jgi:hypothetical protein